MAGNNAADSNVGKLESLSANSLIHYNATGVLATIDACKETVTSFNRVSMLIPVLEGLLSTHWDGIAHDAFHERFMRVFNQVRDIDDGLDKIYEVLMEAQGAFYEADETFMVNLNQTVHEMQKGGGGQASQGGDGETYAATVGEGFTPALTYTPLPAKPELVSTMGAAYTPDLSYATMSPKPELSSCLPSPLMVLLAYQSLSLRDEIKHNTAEALLCVLNKDMQIFDFKDVLNSVIDEPYVPDLSYTELERKDELSSTIGEAYFPDLSYATMERRNVLESLMGAAVIAQVINGYLQGSSREELATQIGEAVISQLNGDYPAEVRDVIVQNVGDAVVTSLFGDGTGAAAGTGLPSLDTYSAWTDNLNTLVDDTVSSTFEQWYLGDAAQVVQQMAPYQNLSDKVIVQAVAMPNPQFQVVDVPMTPTLSMGSVAAVEPSTVTVAMGRLADHSNGVAVQRIIAGSVQEQSGYRINLSMLPSTNQSASQSGYTIQISAQPDGGASLQTLLQHDANSATLNVEAITGVAKDMCQTCVVMDFSTISFPIPAA